MARRGRPAIIYSDNGTKFMATDRAFRQLDWEIIKTNAIERINWRFNPPTAAWWGGWWERLIRLLKQLLKKTLGRASLTYEELETVLCDCEALINSRPLTYVSEDVADLVQYVLDGSQRSGTSRLRCSGRTQTHTTGQV